MAQRWADAMHFSIFTSQTPPQLEWSKRVFALMPLADACALLRRGELNILHILRYKYLCDVYCTRWGSGAKALGSYSILLSLVIVVVKGFCHCRAGLLWLCEPVWERRERSDSSGLRGWSRKRRSNSSKVYPQAGLKRPAGQNLCVSGGEITLLGQMPILVLCLLY